MNPACNVQTKCNNIRRKLLLLEIYSLMICDLIKLLNMYTSVSKYNDFLQTQLKGYKMTPSFIENRFAICECRY